MNFVKLQNQDGRIVECKVGFSWTVFFFGWIPAVWRGDWKWAIILFFSTYFTFGIATLVLAFFYNKFYVQNLIDEKGYDPITDIDKRICTSHGIFVPQRQY